MLASLYAWATTILQEGGQMAERFLAKLSVGIVSTYITQVTCSNVTSGLGVKLTTHLHLVSRLRMRGAIPPLPLHLHVEVFS
jgi:hypothetical protein